MLKLNKRFMSAFSLLVCLALVSACASQSPTSFTSDQQRTPQTIRHGVVTDVTPVRISSDSSGLGVVGGGVIGGVLGSLVGGGRGRVLTTLGGVVVGALGGAVVEKGVRDGNALQVSVKLDDGGEIAVVQGMDVQFQPGDRVRVLTARDGSARVQH